MKCPSCARLGFLYQISFSTQNCQLEGEVLKASACRLPPATSLVAGVWGQASGGKRVDGWRDFGGGVGGGAKEGRILRKEKCAKEKKGYYRW